ncbi:hypothetical protein C3F34_13905 [Acinetobacter sp. ACNIH2]|uniref:hypothetical protein n=1 Tax=Acinetobacter sp. ACNIH2 TaxID=1758189 RepID=UPI000CDCBA7A|nr:hypothetical protein [Acinetobacter sp. ACNIH2]AUX87016.1 hypothetical protein C3F34_13905 [Acinetobacter sp. ACNIH2]
MNQQYKQFGYNPESAKQADSSARIEEAGKYVGIIKHMEFITANSGTTGFEIEFETDNKESASFSIWTEKKDGTPLGGVHKINALLACVGVRGLTPTNAPLEKYDFDAKERITKNCIIAPEITGKRVGLLLQRENYQNNSGDWKFQMNFFSCFHAQSELMAKEIIDRKTSPEALPKSLASLMLNPITTRKPKNVNGGYQQNNGGGYGNNNQGFNQNNGYNQGGFDPFYDDVPPILNNVPQDDFPY